MVIPSLRGLIFTGTVWHRETNYFITWNAVFEKDAMGNVAPSRIEVETFHIFGMMDQETRDIVQWFIILRCFMIAWIALNALATLKRIGALDKLLSE